LVERAVHDAGTLVRLGDSLQLCVPEPRIHVRGARAFPRPSYDPRQGAMSGPELELRILTAQHHPLRATSTDHRLHCERQIWEVRDIANLVDVALSRLERPEAPNELSSRIEDEK